ncbi:hypothetical protein N658DRAFT_459155 [Parathielavia hyrcaniae]|uniref:Uncharacterized protein n=1 Tax=Parathielavia hyrcaniae TaxID=113614 RepID=A0AAN6PQP2_9PEZI|nr:hypothetical protein N658DRAFT_459155 [Parathielavia hyrcaniae]
MAPRTHFTFSTLLLCLGVFAPYIAGQTSTIITTSSSTSSLDYLRGVRACFASDAICGVENDLNDQCEQQREARGGEGYYECVCASGIAAVDEACDNCQLVYGMISTRAFNYTATCSSKGYTLAPIPSSVLDQQSSRNATQYSGTGMAPVEPLTDAVTIQGSPTDLPTVATTFSLPLQTGAAACRLPDFWLVAGFAMAHGLLGTQR